MRGSVYWGIIKENLKKFYKPGDEIVIVAEHMKEDQVCELCGFKPITKGHVLENKRTLNKLTVGSECINNYTKIVDELRSEGKINLINKKYPGIVERTETSDYDKDKNDQESISDLAPEGMGMDDIDWE